jgi:hypothetical protein
VTNQQDLVWCDYAKLSGGVVFGHGPAKVQRLVHPEIELATRLRGLMNPLGDVLQYYALLHVPRMASYDYVPEPQETPLVDASDLKPVELGRLGLPQNSNCGTANGNPAPGPRGALKRATHKKEIPALTSNLPIQIVAIDVRDRLPARAEGFLLHADRVGNESTSLEQNSADFQRTQHLVTAKGRACLVRRT